MLDGSQAHLMLCTLLLVRASQITLTASRVNMPMPCWSTPQSWFLSKLPRCTIQMRKAEKG
eukprot:2242917-Prymnesium_polylepis.1